MLSVQIKFAALADVRSLNQSNSDVVKDISNGVNETAPVVDVKENLPKDPTPGMLLLTIIIYTFIVILNVSLRVF